jgi:hypothetical protein
MNNKTNAAAAEDDEYCKLQHDDGARRNERTHWRRSIWDGGSSRCRLNYTGRCGWWLCVVCCEEYEVWRSHLDWEVEAWVASA